MNQYDTGGDFDLDAAAFLLADSGKVSRSEDFVFYGNLKHPSGCAEHMGDNLTGAGDGDDEQIRINLSAVPENISKIAFTVTIYEAETRRQNFGQVSNAFIRIYNELTGEEMLRYDLGEDFPSRPPSYSESFTKTTENGNSMRLDAAIRAVWRRCAQAMEWKWNRRFVCQ